MMEKQILKHRSSKSNQVLGEIKESHDNVKFEDLLELALNSDDSLINREKVLLLKQKVKENRYIVDFDATGEAIFEEFLQEM